LDGWSHPIQDSISVSRQVGDFPLILTGCILKEVSGMAVAKHYASDLCRALILSPYTIYAIDFTTRFELRQST
jgi:hypothetical protein